MAPTPTWPRDVGCCLSKWKQHSCYSRWIKTRGRLLRKRAVREAGRRNQEVYAGTVHSIHSTELSVVWIVTHLAGFGCGRYPRWDGPMVVLETGCKLKENAENGLVLTYNTPVSPKPANVNRTLAEKGSPRTLNFRTSRSSALTETTSYKRHSDDVFRNGLTVQDAYSIFRRCWLQEREVRRQYSQHPAGKPILPTARRSLVGIVVKSL
ncbi:hypothetical protein F4801DRAFT_278872 [Xylaria longipes]|nr:hypothetical protein F4801DRAFT_278872 [Xylaria longipes]